MRRVIVPILIVGILGLGVFLWVFKKDWVTEQYDSTIGGFPKAKSAEQCAELFAKAIKERNYKKAAKYCTKEYADQLIRCADAARELGKAIDDLTYRMEKDGVLTSEIETVLFLHDPLGPNFKFTVKSAGDSSAVADVSLAKSTIKASPGNWTVEFPFLQALYFQQPNQWAMTRDENVWRFNLGLNAAQVQRIDTLIARHKNYANAFKKMSEELRVERTTKNDVEKRLKELITEAATAKQ